MKQQYICTSSDVKSGRKKVSFSKSFPQGSKVSSCSALSTSVANLRLVSLLTTAEKPSHSPRTPNGSRYDSMNPMYSSTMGPLMHIVSNWHFLAA